MGQSINKTRYAFYSHGEKMLESVIRRTHEYAKKHPEITDISKIAKGVQVKPINAKKALERYDVINGKSIAKKPR